MPRPNARLHAREGTLHGRLLRSDILQPHGITRDHTWLPLGSLSRGTGHALPPEHPRNFTPS